MDETNQRKYHHLWKLVVLLLTGLGVWFYLASRIDYPEVVRIGDGSPVGRYAALNQDLQRRLAPILKEKFGSVLELVHTDGSVENLRRVEEGGLHLAFYQEGVGHSEKVRSVVNLEYEYVFVVVPDGSAKQNLADLSANRLNLGPSGSGTYRLAHQILDYYPLRSYQEKNYSFAEVEERFAEELDAAFFVAGLQAPALSQFLQTGSYRILPLEFAPAMSSAYSWVAARPIPASTFARIPRALPAKELTTLAVKSALIAGSRVPAPLVETVVRTILETPYVQENNLNLLSATQQTGFAYTNPQFPLHPGAQSYYFPWKPKIPSDFVESWNGIIGLLVLLGSGVYTAVVQIRQRREKNRRNREMAKKNALDNYIHQLEEICQQVLQATTRDELARLRRQLNMINLQASIDYRAEKFRSSEDFTAFTVQVNYVLAQIVAKIQEVGWSG